jgi:hypothetical protein
MEKTTLYIIYFLLIQIFGIQTAKADHLNYTYTNIVFADNANVREQPSTKSKILGKLTHGTVVVQCHELDGGFDSIGGVAGYWRPIQFNNGIGYIWEHILADGYFRSTEFKEDVFMLKHNAKKEMEFKVFRKGNIIHHSTHKGMKGKSMIGSTPIGKTYFSKNKEVLAIVFGDPDYGSKDGYLLFTWNRNEIKHIDYKLNDESIWGIYPKFEKGIINANLVNVREEPNTSSKIIFTSSKYMRVKIDSLNCSYEKTGEEFRYWHRITIGNKTGYVANEYLDVPIRYIKSNRNLEESFLYTDGGIYVFKSDTIAFVYPFKNKSYLRDNEQDNNYFVNFGHRGLNPNYQTLSVCQRAFSCGYWSGDNLYVWDGTSVKYLGSDGGVGDGQLSEGIHLIFPTDLGGIEGKIIEFEYASDMEHNLRVDECSHSTDIYEYKTVRHLEYVNDSLIEVPSIDFYLREYLKGIYPNHDLMQYEFADLNGDSMMDALFVLHTRDYEKKEKTKKIVGVVYGNDSSSFKDIKVNSSILKPDLEYILILKPDNKFEIWLIENMTYRYNSYQRAKLFKYEFNVEPNNTIYWLSKTEEWGEYIQSNIVWMGEEKQHFKTKKISFENAW